MTWVAVAIAASLAVTWWSIDWAWSPVDDAGHVLGLRSLIDERGAIGGIVAYAGGLSSFDREWGLFRPAYWAYPAFFYLLDPAWAHLVRLAMAALALLGPLVYFHRMGARGARLWMIAALLAAAASSLYIGLFLVSLQELSAAAFVGVGLMFRSRWSRWAAWTIAAWFKAPFAWLLVGQAIADWRRGDRRLAWVNAATGLGTLALAALMARTGTYTSRYALDPFAVWANAQKLLEPMNALLIVGLVWWLAVTRSRLNWTNDTVAFGVGWLGYTAQLLPWGVTAYYMGPISFLFGLLLCSMLTDAPLRKMQSLVAVSVPIAIAALLIVTPLRQGLSINGAMRLFQDCLQSRPSTASVLTGQVLYVTTSEEAPVRIVQNLQIEDSLWDGSVVLGDIESSTRLPIGIDLLLHAGAPLSEPPVGTRIICGNSYAQVYGR